MAYVDELLGRGEQILYVARQHIAVLMSRIIIGLVLIALLIAAGVVSNTAFSHNNSPLIARWTASDLILFSTLIISIIVLFNILMNFLRWNAEQYILTDRRIIQITGVLSKTVIDSSLSKINDVAFSQNLLGRMFDFGSIEILTGADETTSMEGVAEPLQFKRAMLEAKHNYERGYGYLDQQMYQASQEQQQPVLAQFDVHRTLEELARLRDRGILSRDEFEAKKRELLNRI